MKQQEISFVLNNWWSSSLTKITLTVNRTTIILILISILSILIISFILRRQSKLLYNSEENKEKRRLEIVKKQCALFDTKNGRRLRDIDEKDKEETENDKTEKRQQQQQDTQNEEGKKENNDEKQRLVKKKSKQVTKKESRPKLLSTNEHPGLTPFSIWYDSMTSLYRVYTIASSGETLVIPPIPKSERGYVSVQLQVSNAMKHNTTINVYWLDYYGNEDHRGTIYTNQIWTQTTWIGHPWIFRNADTDQVLLYFVPYRVIPSCPRISTTTSTSTNNKIDGLFHFSIGDSSTDEEVCHVMDKVFPLQITSTEQAIQISIDQMDREDILPDVLLKYLYNITLHPNDTKYRQLSLSSRSKFYNTCWINGCRGIFHALGFITDSGSYAEMGPNSKYLSLEQRQLVLYAIKMLENYAKDLQIRQRNSSITEQPRGAVNGSATGRAGWRI